MDQPQATTVMQPQQQPDDVSSQPQQTPRPDTTQKQFITSDGKLVPGWKDVYVPEDLRSYKIFDNFKDLQSIAKTLVNQEQLIRRQGKIMPDENAPKSVWDVWWKSIGRPDSPEEYKYNRPEDIEPEDLDPEFLKQVYQKFHQAGLTQKQADAVLDTYCDHIRQIQQMVLEEEQKQKEQCIAELQKKWGNAYDSRLHLANKMIHDFTKEGSPERQALLENYGNDPIFADFLATVASKFVEHKVISEYEQFPSKTPADIEAEISQLKAIPGFILPDKDGRMLKYTNRQEYDRLVGKLHNLENELRLVEARNK